MIEEVQLMVSQEGKDGGKDGGLDLYTFTRHLDEIKEQPPFRARADREMDYYDGNQLDAEILQKQREKGIPPAVEPIIGPTIDSVLGLEVKTRADWRVTAIGGRDGADDVAEALNEKLNLAEKESRADRACSDAFKTQICVGIGWVEVSREPDPFKFPYRCKSVHRNEIWWDWSSRESDLSDARYLIRRRWMDRDIAVLLFPQHRDLIERTVSGWNGFDFESLSLDGGDMTGLAMRMHEERGWSIEEQEWRDITNRRVCIFEVWYRSWERVLVIRTPDGRIVEYDNDNMMHVAAVVRGGIQPEQAIVSRMNRAYYLGPHKLHDGPSPYSHNKFPYVPFFGKLEDRTRVPYALIRGMMFLQDEVNARISKMHWGLAATRTIRTDGVYLGTDEQLHGEAGRLDADIVLDPKAMAKQGAMFEIERDFELNVQQAARLIDAREGIPRSAGVTAAFKGEKEGDVSGVAFDGLVSQSTQALAEIYDNFKDGREQVGDLLVSMIVEDMGSAEEKVFIPGNGVKDDRAVTLNAPTFDEKLGIKYLDNDVQRTKLKVTLSDVVSTASFRAQQLNALSEAVKGMPAQYQAIMLPHMFTLMDIPDKKEIIQAIKQANSQYTPEQVDKKVKEAVVKALKDAGAEEKRIAATADARYKDAQTAGKTLETFLKALETAGFVIQSPEQIAVADNLIETAHSVVAPPPAPPQETITGIPGTGQVADMPGPEGVIEQ
jgi:hypothetical protein